MITIGYDSVRGMPIRDGDVDEEFQIVINYHLKYGVVDSLYYSTANIIHRFRIGVLRGELSPDNLVFTFNDQILHVDKNGRIDSWPEGFCDLFDKQCEELLDTREIA